MSKKILILENINVTYNKDSLNERKVLHDVNLEVAAGDFIAIIGHNGSGKSTLLNVISGVTEIDSGRIILDDKDITNLSVTKRAAHIRRVFQDPKYGTAPRMTVAENLMLAETKAKMSLRLQSIKAALPRYTELLTSINNGLENLLNNFAEDLSGGQRQTLSFIMSTMVNPKILLLDEHTAALDPLTSVNMMQLTDKVVQEKQLTCLMITHDMQDAVQYGNRLLAISNGKIIKDIKKAQKQMISVNDLNQLFVR